MAKSKRPQGLTFTTPKGVFRFPKLSEVDYGSGDYPKPNGEYSLQLVLQAADPAVQEFLGKLEPLYRDAMANAEVAFKALKAESRKKLGTVKENPLYTELLDQDTEEPTGEIAFKFTMNASGEKKDKAGKGTGEFWDSRPTVFAKDTSKLIEGFRGRARREDEEMKDVHKRSEPNIWGGTVGKVSFEVGVDRDGKPGYFIPGSGAAGLKLGLNAVQVLELVSGGQRSASDYGFENEDEDGEDDSTPGNGDF